ncbi:MAG: apolipoprotein N-acyltransferase, partial [Candidatus Omnitrophota bacterium]
MDRIKTIFKNPIVLAVTSAVLLRLAYPKFNAWFLAWFAFLPLFFAIRDRSLNKIFLVSFLSGTLFYILTIFWLIHVTIPGMLLLSVYLGFYVALFFAGLGLLERRLSFWQRLFFAPAWWVVLEFCRGYFLTGFPWALLGYSQTFFPAAIQVADFTGVAGVSFMVMFVNIWAFELWNARAKGSRLSMRRVLVPVVVIILWLGYGAWRLVQDPGKTCPLKVAVVQGNISQELKWVPWLKDNILKKYQLLSEIVSLKSEPDVIIWPETAYPDFWGRGGHEEAFLDFVRQLRTPLLVGLIRQEGANYFNSAFLFSSTGNIEASYDKIHLVPFGEYIPLRRFLSFLEEWAPIADFRRGRTYSLFSLQGLACPVIRFGVLICFEDIFSDLASAFVRRGADVLVNITNDAWFGDTASPYQHLQASVFRAVENRVFVVRSANTGISGIIDDAGRIQGTVRNQKGKEAFITGDYTGSVYRTQRQGVYPRIIDLFSFLCSVFVAGLLGLVFFRRRTKKVILLLLLFGFCMSVKTSVLCAAEDQKKETVLRYYRGVVFYEAGNYDNALTEFQAVTALDPYYRDSQKYIENCIKILERYRQSIVQPAGVEASRKSNTDLYFLGRSYYEKKEYRRALEVFRSILAKDPGDR